MNIKTTDKVKGLLLAGKTKVEIADKLDIQRSTLDNRLKKHNWKKPEISIIEGM